IARFDLTLYLVEAEGGLRGTLEYNTDLFDEATITRMLSHFQTLLAGIVADPSEHLSRLPLLTDSERKQVHSTWNATPVEYLRDCCIQQLFEAQVARTPDAAAVRFGQ